MAAMVVRRTTKKLVRDVQAADEPQGTRHHVTGYIQYRTGSLHMLTVHAHCASPVQCRDAESSSARKRAGTDLLEGENSSSVIRHSSSSVSHHRLAQHKARFSAATMTSGNGRCAKVWFTRYSITRYHHYRMLESYIQYHNDYYYTYFISQMMDTVHGGERVEASC